MALRAARENAGLTQSQVAEKAGVTELSYQRYEYDKRTPSVRTAIRIAKALNKDTGDMESLFREQQSTPDGNQANQ